MKKKSQKIQAKIKRKQAMGIFDDDEEEVKEEEKVIEEKPIIKEVKKKVIKEKKGYNGPWPYPINYTNKKTLHNHYLDKKSVKKNISKKEKKKKEINFSKFYN